VCVSVSVSVFVCVLDTHVAHVCVYLFVDTRAQRAFLRSMQDCRLTCIYISISIIGNAIASSSSALR
jgi:hypothetical protein